MFAAMGLRNSIARLVLGDALEARSAGSSVAIIQPDTLSPYAANGPSNALRYAPETGLATSTMYRGVVMIADSLAAMPWASWDPRSNTLVQNQPSILRRPDPFHERNDTIRQIVTQLLLFGDAYLWLTAPDRSGRPTVAIPIDPLEVSISWNDSRTRPVYRWRGQVMERNVDLLHIKYLDDVRFLEGLGPIQAARFSVSAAVQAERFSEKFYTDDVVPDAVLQTPNRLTKPEADDLRAQWETTRGGRRGTAILEGGLEYNPIQMSNADAQYIESRQFSSADIARLLGIPAPLLNASSAGSSTLQYRNQEGLFTEYATFAIQPMAERLETAFAPLIPTTQEIRFDFTRLVRADAKTRYDVYNVALANEILTVNEVRRLENLPPISGGGDIPVTRQREGEAADVANG